jgi:hypothetical protein
MLRSRLSSSFYFFQIDENHILLIVLEPDSKGRMIDAGYDQRPVELSARNPRISFGEPT